MANDSYPRFLLRAMALMLLLGPASYRVAAQDSAGSNADATGLQRLLAAARATGAARFDYFSSDRLLDDELNFYGVTLQTKLEPTFNEVLNGKIEMRATAQDLSRSTAAELVLLETLITANLPRWRIRFGKQIVAWGRTDGINPTDNLAPRSYVAMLPFEEDQRIGVAALTVDRYFGDDYSLSTFTTPYFEPSTIPLPAGQAIFVDRRPAHRLSNSELGLRLNKTGSTVDWSLSYFRGYSLLPDLLPAGFSVSTPILALNYGRTTVYGADFAANLARFGLRGEIAYAQTANDNGSDPYEKRPYLYGVLGADRTIADTVNINLQFFARHVYRYRDSSDFPSGALRAVADLSALLNSQQDRDSYGLTLRVSARWFNNTLQGEILALDNLTRSNSYVRPLLTYAATDHLSFSVGGDFYRGAANTFFGFLQKNRGVFAEIKYAR